MLLGMGLIATASFKKLGARVFGFSLALWGALSGFFALFLYLSWAFSEHTVLVHNANLWVLWPLDWLYLCLGIVLVVKGAMPRQGSFFLKLTGWFTLGHLVTLVIYALLAIGGLFAQNVFRVLVYFGPLSLLLYGFTLNLAGLRWNNLRSFLYLLRLG